MNYKLTIYGNDMYQEFALNEQFSGNLTMGTQKECQLCFEREQFRVPFVIRLDQQEKDTFVISCSNKVFFKKEDGLKEYVRYLQPGDSLVICYTESEEPFFGIDFAMDFPVVGKDYSMAINFGKLRELSIGGAKGCRIQIDDPILKDDCISIQADEKGYTLDASAAKYGISVNDFPIKNSVVHIHDGDFFSLRGYGFNISQGVIYTTKNAVIITDLPINKLDNQTNYLRYPKFKQNVRQQYQLPDEEIEILKPSQKEEAEEKGFLMTFMPVLINLLLMVGLRGLMGGNMMFALYFVGTMAVSTTVSLISFFQEKKKNKEREAKRRTVYMEYLTKQEDRIIELRKKERVVANQMNPTMDEYMRFIMQFDARLFEKRKEHKDYLSVRLGSGVVKSALQVKYKQEDFVETEDDLAQYPQVLHEKYEYLDDMPVVLDLKDTNAVGFVGARTKLYQIEKNLIMEFAASHFYNDVKIFLIMDENDTNLFGWARWLKNTYNETTKTRNFMYNEESAKISLEFLYSELSRRESIGNCEGMEDYIVFVYKSDVISDHPVSQYVEKANVLGFHFVFFEEHEELLNKECTKRIFLNAQDNTGYVQDVTDGQEIQEFTYSHIGSDVVEAAAKHLACVYIDEVSLENSLTKNITLFELLGILSPYDLNLQDRWANSKIYESMAAPLGVKSGNEIVCLDLHEKFHGPHGLVAGTTGSGKSEIMQSYILSIATLFHPYEVGFIIIDFKGGGMANQFKDLPHLIGTITNIDGKEIDRSLLSIKAELVKRQELFAQQSVHHIDDYIRAFKEGKAETPLPHLILIVDEFAELKSDQPEFMKELISAARIGRSLGVHLILATQKPAGVVNDQIWSNSKFKLCLKVQNKSDSNEVLKSPLAAEIREPGRAYLQVGNNEIFQLFQSAFSGAPAHNDRISNQKKFRISSVDLAGKRTVIYEQAPKNNKGGETQLDALVSYVHEYCEKNEINRLPSICLPSLPKVLSYTMEGFRLSGTDIEIPIGMVDDPGRQNQFVESLNFSQSNIYIIGSSQSGKTCMLQSIVKGLTMNYSPEDVNIYIMDFASMILKNFEALSHVGGVVTSSEDEKLKNFLKMIQEMIASRKTTLSKMGLSSFSSYREAGGKDMAQIVVLLDNWIAFKSYYPEYEDLIIGIVRESVSVGISFVVTVSQSGGVGFKLLSNFSKRIALYCNDSSDYLSLYEGCRMKLDDIPGRGIAEINRAFYDCQYYLAFAAEKEYERVKLITEFIKETNAKYPTGNAKGIPVIPEHVTEKFLLKQFGTDAVAPYDIPLGMEYNSINIRRVPLSKMPFMAFVGSEKSSRGKYINYMLEYQMRHAKEQPLEHYIIDERNKPLSKFEDDVKFYSNSSTSVTEVLSEVFERCKARYEGIQTGEVVLNDEPYIMVVINSTEGISALTTNREDTDRFKKIIGMYKEMKVCFLFTNVENAQIPFSATDALKTIRDSKRYLVFEDIKDIKIMEPPAQMARVYKKPIDASDVYLINGTVFEKIRFVSAEE